MQGYIFNKEFTLVRIIDSFISFIWNEAYIGYGDFEMKFVMDENALAYVDEGYYVSIDESDRYMVVENVRIKTSFTEGSVCTISGRGLESILERRILPEKILVNGSLQKAILRLLNETIANPKDQDSKIDGFSMLTSTDPEIMNLVIEGEYKAGENLYIVITNICSQHHLGFRIDVYNERFFEFRLYKGLDHSYAQEKNPWIVFSSQYENLVDSSTVINTMSHKNVIVCDILVRQNVTTTDEYGNEVTVTEEHNFHKVYGSTNVKGIDRRELYASYSVDADSINKNDFGKAEDRVNIRDYQEWQLVYFDSEGFKEATRDYYASVPDYNDRTPRKIDSIVRKRTEAEGFHPELEGTSSSWINNIREDVYENPEDAAKRSAKYNAMIDAHAPKRETFEIWGYDFTAEGREAYQKAISREEAIIDEEFNKAKQAMVNYALELCHQKALEELLDPKYRDITSFEGNVDPNVNFVYGRDYRLGDIVQVVNQYSFNAVTRVTSVLISWDSESGYNIAPTFTSDNVAEVNFDLPDFNNGKDGVNDIFC